MQKIDKTDTLKTILSGRKYTVNTWNHADTGRAEFLSGCKENSCYV